MRDDRERLLDIQEAIERIEKYTSSDDFKQQNPEISWIQITGM